MNTNFVELAIQKAVEGGWNGDAIAFGVDKIAEPVKDCWKVDGWWYSKEIFLDPKFFAALGKTEGWGETMFPLTFSHREDGLNEEPLYWKGENGHQYVPHLAGKKYYQHRLIDAIQQGRSIDEFFGEILKK